MKKNDKCFACGCEMQKNGFCEDCREKMLSDFRYLRQVESGGGKARVEDLRILPGFYSRTE